MEPLKITAFDLAQRYVGIKEIAGGMNHPLIQWWLSLCGFSLETPDETPWCSAFVNGIAWELRLPRSKSAAARSWLTVGRPIDLLSAQPGFDVAIIKRGEAQPGAAILNAPGHVGFYAGRDPSGTLGANIHLLAGNQGNMVSIAGFPQDKILGIRRLVMA
jgi:uncharacterized protein (TIGR02594 family)